MSARRVAFAGFDGSRLAARLDMPATPPCAFALFAHCFTCGKNGLTASRISAALNAQGIAVLRFDFTGLGMSEGQFADTNFSSNVAALRCATDFLRCDYQAPSLLIGHSLGGTAVLAAAHAIDEVRAVVALGAPSEPAHLARQLRHAVEQLDTEREVAVSLAGRPFRIQRQWDLKERNLHERIATLGRALLVMHAPHDDVVDIDHARRIFEAAKHPKSFVALDGADHLLSGPKDAAYAVKVIAAWVDRYLPEEAPSSSVADGQVRVVESGTGRFTQHVQVGRHVLMSDEPGRAGGDDAGPAPYDYLLAALGACTSITLRMVAERKGWQIEPFEVTMERRFIQAEDCSDCDSSTGQVLEIDRHIRWRGSIDPAVGQRLLEVADRCPVHRALLGEIKVRTYADGGLWTPNDASPGLPPVF